MSSPESGASPGARTRLRAAARAERTERSSSRARTASFLERAWAGSQLEGPGKCLDLLANAENVHGRAPDLVKRSAKGGGHGVVADACAELAESEDRLLSDLDALVDTTSIGVALDVLEPRGVDEALDIPVREQG